MPQLWYFKRGQQEFGPVTLDDLLQLASPETLVRSTKTQDWVPASSLAAANQTATPPKSANQTHLAELQKALLDGRIDKSTYDEMKSDLVATATSNADQPIGSEALPPNWVVGEIHLIGKHGINASGSLIEVFLDSDYLGKGSLYDGIHLNFETTIGHHSLKLVVSNSLGRTKVGQVLKSLTKEHVHPLLFESPGNYSIEIRKSSLLKNPSGKKLLQTLTAGETPFEIVVSPQNDT